MKKYITTLVIIIIGLQINAQTTYKGKIVDINNKPLSGVNITVLKNKKNGTVSDFNGAFTITTNTPNVIISAMGYSNKSVTLTNSKNYITLQENTENLDEVIVSASREQQKRADIPGAIAVLNSKSIKETKAFGIEQLVNQVPGVFMSTSSAASNEQHFMSVRSPISTKALFLYLEDGLPIRPTSVFNHNALLELNNTAIDRIEILKGPASSIYGSESIGGSFNFITKEPTKDLEGSLGFQINDLGLTRYDAEVGQYTSDAFGFYLGTHYVQRKDGPLEHSDYEKFAVTFKTINRFSSKTKWSNVFDVIDFRSDMSGSLSEADYSGGNFESDQTFTERDALAFRFRSTLDTRWNDNNKTSFNFIFRDNRMDQNPSFRIRQFRNPDRSLNGFGSGEVNSNQFKSYVGLIQHKINFNFANSSLIIGGTTDFSPQDYVAETTAVIVNPTTGRNSSFRINSGDFLLNYKADIFNYAGYFQYEINPINALKVTAALRYDSFRYDFDNLDEGTGASDAIDKYNNLTPKLGLNYNFNSTTSIYANYSQGFTPPQASTLYRNRNGLIGIKPSRYNNYEIGGYYSISSKLKLDTAIYLLDGKNTLITLRDNDDNFFNTNAGKTRSYGIEYGIKYTPTKEISIAYNGSYAKHRYINFFDRGINYSDTDRETAPKLLGNTNITYKPNYIKNFSIGADVEIVGKYNTSFEGQVANNDGTFSTATYDGHSILNLKASYKIIGIEIWAQGLNIFDSLYAARASYNRFRSENSYTIGTPRAIHAGIKYNF